MKKAFTIAELMVAVVIMALTLVGVGWVFKVSIEAQRRSAATTEIMRNLRAISDQLHADFSGLRKDGFIEILFQPISPTVSDIHADRIWFTATGDFQATRQYPDANGNEKVVNGNVAIITYALTSSPDPLAWDTRNTTHAKEKNYTLGPQKMLARRQTIFTSDAKVQDPCTSGLDYVRLSKEYIKKSYSEWRRSYIGHDFTLSEVRDLTAVNIDTKDTNETPMLLATGVEDFSISVVEKGRVFDDTTGAIKWVEPNSTSGGKKESIYPVAFKFSFTLYSRTLIDGKPLSKRFTQIIDLKEEN